jgi:hypothetical protein
MKNRSVTLVRFGALVWANVFFAAIQCFGQAITTGSIIIQTTDPTKAALPGAHLVLQDKSTNETRQADTLSSGNFTFYGLTPGDYHLTVLHAGFSPQNYDSIIVQVGHGTTLDVVLSVGSDTQQITVSGVSVPVIETTSNMLSTTVDLQQIQNLPLQNRDLTQFIALAPGFAGTTTSSSSGTFNGTAGAAFQANVDGVNSTASRFKSAGGNGNSVQARLEDIHEFTVQTGELDPSQGAGQSAVQVLFVTNRGTNKFHGRAFEDFQGAFLNANSWINDNTGLPKTNFTLHDFGFSIGGPIWKDKLFFFASFAENRTTALNKESSTVPTAAAIAGNYSYFNANNGVSTINVLQVAQAAGCATCSGTINPAIASQIALNSKTYGSGTLTQSTSQLNTQTLNWTLPSPTTNYFPSARLDYVVNPRLQLNLSGNWTKTVATDNYQTNPFPGSAITCTACIPTGFSSNSYVAAIGADWSIKPTILNQARFGFLYNANENSPEAKGLDVASQSNVAWNFANLTSGNSAVVPQGSYYPYFTFNDDVSWQKGSHTIRFGGNIFREQDHYYNPPLGFNNIQLGISTDGVGDPVANPLLNSVPTAGPNAAGNLPGAQGDVQSMYAWLNGRIVSGYEQHPYVPSSGKYEGVGSYNLDELLMGGGVYLQDNWRAHPGLTLNFGLRWDFIGDDHDLKNGYTGPSPADLYGPSGFGNLFKPGVLTGNPNPIFYTAGHKYNPNLILPQPQIGFVYNPSPNADSMWGRLLGKDKSVFRASYTLKNYTEGGQNFWQAASNFGFNFYQNANLFSDDATLGTGHFNPGTLNLQGTNSETDASLPPYLGSPLTYQATVAQSSLTFTGNGAQAINPNIKEPYVESWTLGYQRQFGHSNAIEIRYVGNRSVHDWLTLNPNETNLVESGFLADFKAAQQNLAINRAGGIPNDFSNHGSGPAMPILTAAFGGSNGSNFQSGRFISDLMTGNAGDMGGFVGGGDETSFCNVVGQTFSPCAAAGAGPLTSKFPINLFQANPYLAGQGTGYLDSTGTSNYNSLQVEYRQQGAHGLAMNVNYTLAKTLGISQQGGIGSSLNIPVFTLHNLHYNYLPSNYDIRNTLHVSGTYELPFGQNKHFLSSSRVGSYFVGGWTIGSIITYQSGAPSLLLGGLTSTYNPAADGGVAFVGSTTASTIQKSVHITHSPGNPYVNFLGSKFQGQTAANPAYAVPNETPGTFGNLNVIYGPKWNNIDMAVTKDIPVESRVHITLQGEFLNAFNHPAWLINAAGTPPTTVLNSPTFGTTSNLANQARRIELRGNVTF